jgi:hypothetical protein
MSIEITLSHRNASELNDEVADVFGRSVVARVADDVLLAELRVRMLERRCTVKIEPIREDVETDASDAVAAEASAGAA